MQINAGGNLAFPNGFGIDFSASEGADASSSVLNDYEEGTWTPIVGKESNPPSVTYTLQEGTYTKVGRLVTIWFDIRVSSVSGGTGGAVIGGLPFTVLSASAGGGYGAPQLRDPTLLDSNIKTYGNSSYLNDTRIFLKAYNSSGAEVGVTYNGSGRVTGQATYQTTG